VRPRGFLLRSSRSSFVTLAYVTSEINLERIHFGDEFDGGVGRRLASKSLTIGRILALYLGKCNGDER